MRQFLVVGDICSSSRVGAVILSDGGWKRGAAAAGAMGKTWGPWEEDKWVKWGLRSE